MKTERTNLVIKDDTKSPFAEAYRTLNTNIKFSNLDQPAKSILVTSSGATEGKSTTVANLGIIMAQQGSKVLLVDTDLRKPILHTLFGIKNSKGFSKSIINTYNTDLQKGTGTLKEFGVGDIIKLIGVQQKTGLLVIKTSENCIHVYFNNGKIMDANWENKTQGKGLGNRLLKSGKITQENLQECLQTQKETSQPLSSVLVNADAVDMNDLKGHLHLHMEDTFRQLFALNDGSFSFHSKEYINFNSDLEDFSTSLKPIMDRSSHTNQYPFINKNLHSLIQETGIENLKIITSGPLPPNPSSVLSSKEVKEFMYDIKSRFDIILYDSPPILAASDASILATMVDGVVLVIRSGQLARNVVQIAKEQLEGINARILGVVLNSVDIKKESYYYYYYSQYTQYYYKKENPPIVPDTKQ
ncbi:MAG: polysaccharide biosynthesis tyrosine autokinase [Thermodesulfobacteriota bacterium]|nr:polysaccharide biosynthesis tyrosine autokinase [Thermodesulfobacteriota bacterium]